MDKSIIDFNNKFGMDFVEDYLMALEDRVYFYIELSENPLSSSKIELLSGNWQFFDKDAPNGIVTFDYILSLFDEKCEHAQVNGVKAVLQELISDINSENNFIRVDIPIKVKGIRYWLGVKIQKYPDKNVAIGRIKEVTSSKTFLEKLYMTSYKDALTGLFNRNTCMMHLASIQKNSNTYIFMIDLDNFKKVNDTYGHGAGDKVLKMVGEKMLELVDDNRIFYRLSGDEFLIQVKDYSFTQAEEFAKEIISKLNEITYEDIRVSVSVGAVKQNDLHDNMDLLRFADRAMYFAKKKRNTYCILEE